MLGRTGNSNETRKKKLSKIGCVQWVGEAMIPTEASKQKMGRGSGIKKDKTEGIAAADHLYDPLSHRSDDRESKGPKKKKKEGKNVTLKTSISMPPLVICSDP